MKKTVLFGILIALGSSTMVSCKKDYNCVCTRIYTNGSGATSYQDDIYTFKDTRTRAENRCNDEEKTGTDLVGGSYSRECEIR
jgi:hypothetical protein